MCEFLLCPRANTNESKDSHANPLTVKTMKRRHSGDRAKGCNEKWVRSYGRKSPSIAVTLPSNIHSNTLGN